MTEVKVISHKGKAQLVEWEDESGIHRGVLPIELEKDELEDNIDQAIPYGIDWETIYPALANPMRKAGIWTKEDFDHNQDAVVGILREQLALSLSNLRTLVHNEEVSNE